MTCNFKTSNQSPTPIVGAVEYSGVLYCWSNRYHHYYTFNGETVTRIGSLPYNGTAKLIVVNGKLHGFFKSGNGTSVHYILDGDSWITFQQKSYVDIDKGALFTHQLYMYYLSSEGGFIRLENPKATLTFVAKNLLKDSRAMNNNTTRNDGGWSATELRTYLNGDFVSALPTSLQSAIKTVNKLSDGGHNSPNIINTEDNIWIPSLDELMTTYIDNYVVRGQGSVYPVFTDNASRQRTKYGMSETLEYSSRTAHITNMGFFQGISGGGSQMYYCNLSTAYPVLIGFCI